MLMKRSMMDLRSIDLPWLIGYYPMDESIGLHIYGALTDLSKYKAPKIVVINAL
jgi:hypothetical protein